jgi:PKD repeat protein
MKNLLTAATIFLLGCFSLITNGQMRQLRQDPDPNNYFKSFSFYSASEGYTCTSKYIGFTQDSGHTYTPKYIGTANVDFGNYAVGLPFFNNGCKAFNRDTIIVYGSYSLIPAILYSIDQGNSFKLVFYSSVNNELNWGILDMVFPSNTKTGYAIDQNRILKTTNRGINWAPIYINTTLSFNKLFFLDDNTGYAITDYKILKTTNGGINWQEIPLPVPGQPVEGMYFLNENKGYVSQVGNDRHSSYYTINGGTSWELRNTDEFQQSFGQSVYFVDDTTGYTVGDTTFTVFKTTDGARTWERLERNNNYSMLAYTFSHLYFWNSNQFWAGGNYTGYNELTTNGGGNTLPNAYFKVDLSGLSTTGTVNLINHSKNNYTYKWLKNGVQISTSYNTSYISPRTSIDTILLIVYKSGFSDTATAIFDTRAVQPPCNAGFTNVVDTSTMKFTAAATGANIRHYWYFGDGTLDSVNVSPVHKYTQVGYFMVKHVVKNIISNCKDSLSKQVFIDRLQKCFKIDFTYTSDSFYTNQYKFTWSFATQTEWTGDSGRRIWNWDDGTVDSAGNIHTFDTGRVYTVVLSIRNVETGCVSSVAKAISVQMATSCNASMLIHPIDDSSGVPVLPVYKYGPVRFHGRPAQRNAGKRHTWTIDGWQTTVTGNSDVFSKVFYKIVYYDASAWDAAGGSNCQSRYHTKEFNVDSSLVKTIRHIVYDSVTNCTDTFTRVFTIPTLAKVIIKVTPDPLFPAFVNLKAYKYNISPNQDTVIFRSRWDVDNYYFSGYNGFGDASENLLLQKAGPLRIAVASGDCDIDPDISESYRQVYYITYNNPGIAPCQIYPPRFTATATTQPNTFTFSIPYPVNYVNDIELGYRRVWYFGNGDSSTAVSPTYSFATSGPKQVTLKYITLSGCSKDTTITVTAGQPCNLTANFTFTRSVNSPNFVQFNNQTTVDTGTISYKWYFGNGDSSAIKSPSYTYSVPGTYTVRLRTSRNAVCTSEMTSIIVVTPTDICNLTAVFTHIVPDTLVPNRISFVNTSSPATSDIKWLWDFGDGLTDTARNVIHQYATSGRYQACLKATKNNLCIKTICDSIIIKSRDSGRPFVYPNPVTNNQLNLQVYFDQAVLYSLDILNQSGATVMHREGLGLQGTNYVSIDIAALPRGLYFINFVYNGQRQRITFIKL